MLNSSPENKKHLLVLTSRFPYPLDKGDKLRIFHQIKELSKNYKITLFSVSDKNVDKEYVDILMKYCIEVHVTRLSWFSRIFNMGLCLLNGRPFQTGYFFNHLAKKKLYRIINSRQIDHIYCQLIRMTEYVKNIHHIPKTLDYMDALSEGVRKRIEFQSGLKKMLFNSEAKRLRTYEQHVFDYFENRTMISDQDINFITHPEQNKIITIPNGVDESFFEKLDIQPDYDFVFVGNMSYPPNIEAVKYIASEILTRIPESKLLVSGANPVKEILALGTSNESITITGWVDDIRISYLRGAIFVAPMTIGTGQQNKILEAMATGTPVITTSLSNNAIQAEHGKQIFVADTPEQFVDYINLLKTDLNARNQLIEEGQKFILSNYSWSKTCDSLATLFK